MSARIDPHKDQPRVYFQCAAARNSIDLFAYKLASILHLEYTYPHWDEAVTLSSSLC